MTRDDALAYARDWIDAWNRKDVEAVLSHFAVEARFTSPRAAATVGTATVNGKDELRASWNAAVARIESIHFELDHPVWDPASRELLIVYTAALNGARNRAGELLRFDGAGYVVEGEALHGATV